MKIHLIAAALGAMFASSAAHATLVSYSSSGSFSGLSFQPGNGNSSTSCAQGSPPCSISSVSGGTNNFLDMSGNNNSTITANNVSGSVNVPPSALGVTVGSLTWVNNASTGSDPSFQVTYTFGLSFNSLPDSQAFTLTITQPTNPPGDNVLNLSNVSLSNLGPYSIAGVSISNIHFALGTVTSLGGVGSHTSSYNGTNWTLDENTRATLNVLADISATPTATPEPVSMALLGTALVGFGMIRRRSPRS